MRHEKNKKIDLHKFFSGREENIETFSRIAFKKKLPKRVFIYRGDGGIGKSSLLVMLSQQCEKKDISFAMVSGGEKNVQSVADVLNGWVDSLEKFDVKFHNFKKAKELYRAAREKEEDRKMNNKNGSIKSSGSVGAKPFGIGGSVDFEINKDILTHLSEDESDILENKEKKYISIAVRNITLS